MKHAQLIAAAFAASPLFAHAAAECVAHPKDIWMKEADLKAALVEAGYKIKKFQVDGNCYEMYGFNAAGKRAEIYMDTVSGRPVKAHIE
jgi:hypothetical protein